MPFLFKRLGAHERFPVNTLRTVATTIVPALLLALAPMGCANKGGGGRQQVGWDRPATPDASIAELKRGNARYLAGDFESDHTAKDRTALAAGQTPWAAILRCADSRVSPEILFDTEKGELFICAVAGNLATESLIASMEYAVLNLETNLIVVCGHSNCGAIEATIKYQADPDTLPGNLPALIREVGTECTDGLESGNAADLAAAIRCNAARGARRMVEKSPVIAEKVASGEVKVIAAILELSTGEVEFIDAG